MAHDIQQEHAGVEPLEQKGWRTEAYLRSYERVMTLSDKEVARLRTLLLEIDKGLCKKAYKSFVGNRVRNIRLMLTKAERREKHRLL